MSKNNIIAYYLDTELSNINFVRISSTEFQKNESGQLRFRDRDGVQFVGVNEWNNLGIFELGDHNWLITESGKFSQNQIKEALVRHHRFLIEKQITVLENQLHKLK